MSIRPGSGRAGSPPFPSPGPSPSTPRAADLRQQVIAVGTVEIAFPDGPRTAAGHRGPGRPARISPSATGPTARLTAPWRVVSTSIPTETGALVVDFNRTVNLPFAFTEYGTCPAPVPENTLPLAVTAGELAPVRVTP